MRFLALASILVLVRGQVTYQEPSGTILRTDNGTYGPPLEEFHYYYDQWPIGLAVSSAGRLFVCYTRGQYAYTLGESVNKTAEAPYPSAELNLPVSSLNTSYNGIAFGSADSHGLISVQALYITPETANRDETLWALDTGRASIMDSQGEVTVPYAQPGGPKLVGISLNNNSIYETFTFPADVHYPDSYMNDVRFDLRSDVTPGGKGVAYIVDSSDEGRPGFIILDLGTGESWRRLTQDPSVLRVDSDVPSYQGHPFYQRSVGQPVGHLREGLDGIQISPDGRTIYYSPLTGNYLYSVPATNLLARDDDPLAERAAKNNVSNLGQRGGNANGFEGDSNGLVYQLVPEHNAIYYYDPNDLQTHGYVRDPRILWPDSASVGEDGYFYVNINQLPYQPMWNNGQDLRVHPGAVLRAKLPNGGTKIMGVY
ncbi:putative major royal jelly protein [Diplodia seriata]|uniref:Putative major royal jelly protein n=1 Tax=Diplodia seriata TaxID=420778 RepID=A0A0G2ELV9_9PEZI|nr:putative major royal jelly protein [Diplodia seriata]